MVLPLQMGCLSSGDANRVCWQEPGAGKLFSAAEL